MDEDNTERCSNCYWHEDLDTETFGSFCFCHYYGEGTEEDEVCPNHRPEVTPCQC